MKIGQRIGLVQCFLGLKAKNGAARWAVFEIAQEISCLESHLLCQQGSLDATTRKIAMRLTRLEMLKKISPSMFGERGVQELLCRKHRICMANDRRAKN